jgi:hypothetical protein
MPLVTRAFAALLALSRYGWREEDLQILLPPAAAVLFPGRPPVAWDALRFAAFRRFFRAHMVARGEFQQFDFAHSSLRAAIRQQLQGAWKPVAADPIPALHTAIADCLETTLHEAPTRPDEMMFQTLGTRDLPRFTRYYAEPKTGSGKLAEFLVEESHTSSQELLRFVLSSIADERLPEAEQAVVGRKFNFDLHDALGERDGWALQGPVLEAASALFDRLVRRNPNSADFARDLWVSYCRMAQIEEHTGGGKALDCWRKAYAAISEMKQRGILLPTDEQYLETLAAKAHGSEPAHSLPAGSGQQSHRVQIHGYYSTPHPSANGAHAAQLNMEYQKARKAWEALPWLKRVRTPKPEPPTGI